MKPLCPLRFDGRSDCACGENHEKLREYGMELKARISARAQGLPRSECLNKLMQAGVPVGTCGALRSSNWEPRAAYVAARDWMDRKTKPVLYLAGPPGCGKTFAAAWCLLQHAKTFPWDTRLAVDKSAMAYVLASEVGTLSSFAVADKELFERLQGARLLLVDELGREGTDWGRGRLAELLAKRIDNNRPTIVTTNLPVHMVAAAYGEHLADRLQAFAERPTLETKSIRSGREWAKAGRAA